jgi:glycosyltransferase involved in cell wall biosynthesis
LGNIFDESNIGLSYIPITKYFDYQPPTKTYEYLLSGIPVIATNTNENKKIINNNNGILINDDIESIRKGFYIMYNNLSIYKSDEIRKSCLKFTWENIINNQLIPKINHILS